jgi:hypothetical protein
MSAKTKFANRIISLLQNIRNGPVFAELTAV